MSALFYLIVFFIAYKDMMKGNEKKTNHPAFSFLSPPNSLMKQ